MPRPSPGPRLVLYGPDQRYGATRRARWKNYIWYVVWSEDGKKREQSTGAGFTESPTAEGRAAAEKALVEFFDRRASDWRGARRPDQVTISDLLDVYAEEHGVHTGYPDRIDDCITALVSWWTDQAVSAISAKTCRAYAKARMAQGRASDTARKELATLRAAIRYCYREGKLTQEVPVVLPDKAPPKEDWLTRVEAAMLLRGARAEAKSRMHLCDFILIGLYTGHRKGAILELQWQPNTIAGHVDLAKGQIDFQGKRKTTKKRRARPRIPQHLMTFLRYIRSRTRQFVVEFQGAGVANIKHAFASAAERAAQAAEKRAREANHPDTRAAWLITAAKFRRATPHILRHTRVTWLVGRGVPYADVGNFVGMSADTVERVYGHHSKEQDARVLKAIDGR